jgi:imidazolonepropionase-like amidohydrolase
MKAPAARVFLRKAAPAVVLLSILIFVQQARTAAPDVFAIRNARIFPVSSPPIQRGNIVIRDGIIEAVGADVKIPLDAWLIDGSNLFVYPGLIDGSSDTGITPQTSAPTGTEARTVPALPRSGQEIARPAEVSNMNTFVRAADLLSPGSRKVEDARAAGITTVLAVPARGIFSGQSALINLNGEKDSMVVRSPVAMHVRFQSEGREYPRSLMGVIAYIRQAVLDARRYQQSWDVYNHNLRAFKRPETNRGLEGLLPVVENKIPIVLPANTDVEIVRALQLGDEIGARYIISGAAEAWKVADRLKSKRVPLLVSLKFPEKEKDVHPEYEEPLLELQRRAEAPKNAARLHQSGIGFAFSAEGLTNPRDFLKNASRAIKGGLPPEAALRALTSTPAEIFGVSEQLGSLEKGKIGNLVVTDGDLFADRTKIRYVFVDGKKFEPPAEESKPTEPAAINVAGKWRVSMEAPQGTTEATFDFTQTENELQGSITSSMGSTAVYDGVVSGKEFRFKAQWQAGERQMVVSYSGTVEGNTIKGRASMMRGEVTFNGTRVP